MPVYEVKNDSPYENMLVDMSEIIFNDGDLWMNSREKVENSLRRNVKKQTYTKNLALKKYRKMLKSNEDYLIKEFRNKSMTRIYRKLLPNRLTNDIVNRLCDYLITEFESLNK